MKENNIIVKNIEYKKIKSIDIASLHINFKGLIIPIVGIVFPRYRANPFA